MSETKRIWIPRETWRQEKAVVLARDAISVSHAFIAHDRSRPSGDKDHMWQWKRGIKKGLPDTQTIFQPASRPDRFEVERGQHCWFEFKSKGNIPDDDQLRMLQRFRDLGDFASWGVMLEDLVNFWMHCGVPLVANAHYRAMVLDGLVDSRIAKAEAKARGEAPPKKRSASPKPTPRFTASRAVLRRAATKGVRI